MEEEIGNVRTPKKGEILGIVEAMLGTNKLNIRCQDGNTRICRIPGRMRRRLWIKEGDVVIIKPWPIQGDIRGDIIFKYKHTHVNWLRRKGILKIR